ncbi:hypothetical protein CK203_116051 [Vitis vinifera]|uniref:Uncharacterized protein n=1 Tax=Vitis vinifera TaxID=29760 RepID=A0A438D0B1_VITVI|nr:hypothetical protein CK203_116051 [Vitis vinifera]
MKKVQEVQAISETPLQAMPCSIYQSCEHFVEECPTIPLVRKMFGDQANVICQFKPNNSASYGNTYNVNWRNHPNFSRKSKPPQYTQPAQAPQQASNLEQAIVNLSKVVEDFVGDQKSINAQLNQRLDSVESTLNKRMDGMQNDLSQKIDNGIHEVEAQEGESSKVREVKAVITLRSGQEVDRPTSKPKHDKESVTEKEKSEEIKGKRKERSTKKDDHESSVDEEPERIVIKEDMMKKDMPPPFPHALHGKKGTNNALENFEVLRQVKCKSPVKYKDPGNPTILVSIEGTCVEKAFVGLGSKNGVMQLTFGNMTLELNIFHLYKKHIHPKEKEGPKEVCMIDTLVEEHCNQRMQEDLIESFGDLDEGLPKPSYFLATLLPWRRREEILPLFNEEETQRPFKEEPQSLFLSHYPQS